ncbi:unnamed protein product [Camellia sinensis]
MPQEERKKQKRSRASPLPPPIVAVDRRLAQPRSSAQPRRRRSTTIVCQPRSGCPVWNASSRTSALGHFTRMVRHSMVEHSCFRTLLHVGLRYASSGFDSSSKSLRFSSAVSILLAVVFVGICSVMAIFALLEGKAKSPRLMPQLDDQASFFNLFTAVPVIVTAFTSHFNG